MCLNLTQLKVFDTSVVFTDGIKVNVMFACEKYFITRTRLPYDLKLYFHLRPT